MPTILDIKLIRGNRLAVADVSSVSVYKEEEEILIAANNGFRIDGVWTSTNTRE